MALLQIMQKNYFFSNYCMLIFAFRS